MPTPDVLAFEADVARALEAAGIAKETAAHDATVDAPGAIGAISAIAAGAAVVLRVSPPIAGGDAKFAPAPVDPVWLRVEGGSAAVTVAPLRGGAATKRTARGVAVETADAECCDAPSCSLRRTHARVWIDLDAGDGPARLLAGEWSDAAAGRATTLGSLLAKAIGAALGVPVTGVAEGFAADAPRAGDAPLGALAIARFGLRSEGDRFVVRDYASLGPRAGASRTTAVGVALLIGAAALAAVGARALLGGATDAGVGAVALGALVTFFGVTYVSVGRHAATFVGRSSPILAVYAGKLLVAPWESREGAVGLAPDGHYGAAVPMPDVTGLRVLPRDGRSVVVIDTDHGPFDGVVADREADGRYWLAAIERAVTAASHPEPRETARKRARERARAETAASTA